MLFRSATPLTPQTIFQNTASHLKAHTNLIMTRPCFKSNSSVHQRANPWPLRTILASHGSPLSSYQPHCLSLCSLTMFCPFPSHDSIGLESPHHPVTLLPRVHSNSPSKSSLKLTFHKESSLTASPECGPQDKLSHKLFFSTTVLITLGD